MAREIQGSTATGNFPPLVGIREKNQFVKGKVIAKATTNNGNPAITLELIDLDGSTSISPSKGVYTEVEVAVGDAVQIIGSVKQLKDKLPQLEIGDVVTITSLGKKKISGGKTLGEYKVMVD
jgi:hypothetical protein